MTTSYNTRNEEVNMNKRKMSTHILGLGIFMVAILILTVALIIGLDFPKFARKRIVDDQCIVDSSHKYYTKWVQESDFSRYNKIYFWNVTNLDDFLEGQHYPVFQELGPYIYREIRTKEKVIFSGETISFYYKKSQIFDPLMTKRFCGPHCNENDKIYLLDSRKYFQFQNFKNINDFIVAKVPDIVNSTLGNLSAQQIRNLLQFTNCSSSPCDWSLTYENFQGLNVSEVHDISFVSWIYRNDTEDKSIFLERNDALTFTSSVIDSFYEILRHKRLFGVTREHLTQSKLAEECRHYISRNVCTIENQGNITLSNISIHNTSDFISQCGLLSVLNRLSNTTSHCLLNFSRLVLSHICLTNCSFFTDDENEIRFAKLIRTFCMVHLWQIALEDTINWFKTVIFQAKSIHDIIHGAIASSQNTVIEEGKRNDVTWTLLSCLHRGHTDTNMNSFGVRIGDKWINTPGHTSYVKLAELSKGCEDVPSPEDIVYITLETIRKAFKFTKMDERKFQNHIVIRYNLSADNFYSISNCHRRRETYPFESEEILYSLPHHFGCSSPSKVSTIYGFKPNSAKHVSYILIEPISGRIWKSSIKLQSGTYFPAMYELSSESSYEDNVVTDIVLPMYWIDEEVAITSGEVCLFEDRIISILDASCGGLIGLGTLACIVAVVSVIVVIIPRRLNRVAPTPDTDDRVRHATTPLS